MQVFSYVLAETNHDSWVNNVVFMLYWPCVTSILGHYGEVRVWRLKRNKYKLLYKPISLQLARIFMIKNLTTVRRSIEDTRPSSCGWGNYEEGKLNGLHFVEDQCWRFSTSGRGGCAGDREKPPNGTRADEGGWTEAKVEQQLIPHIHTSIAAVETSIGFGML